MAAHLLQGRRRHPRPGRSPSPAATSGRAGGLYNLSCARSALVELPASANELDGLLGFVAAEANLEPNRRRQKRFDATFAVLSNALGELEQDDR